MSKQAPDSERVRDGLNDILPGPAQLLSMREQSASNRASP
jgi:hypothetical protein